MSKQGFCLPIIGYAPNFILQSIRAGGHSLQLGPSYLPHTTVACNNWHPRRWIPFGVVYYTEKRRLHLISVSASVEARSTGRRGSYESGKAVVAIWILPAGRPNLIHGMPPAGIGIIVVILCSPGSSLTPAPSTSYL